MASRNRIAADAVSRLRLKTPGTQEYRSWTISLHLCIGLVFTVVIMLLGIILISYSYNRHKDLAFATAGELFDHITQQTAGNISELYAPVEVLVDITASLPLVSTKEGKRVSQRSIPHGTMIQNFTNWAILLVLSQATIRVPEAGTTRQ